MVPLLPLLGPKRTLLIGWPPPLLGAKCWPLGDRMAAMIWLLFPVAKPTTRWPPAARIWFLVQGAEPVMRWPPGG